MRQFHLAILAALLLVFTSCNGVIAVTDYSFKFSGRHYASVDDNYISLTLEDGCPLQKYGVAYVIDSDPSLVLTDDSGSQVKTGSSHDFSKGPKAWKLPILRIGEHEVDFTITGENFSQVLKVPFSVTSEPFSLHAEVSTDQSAGTSTLLLTLAQGVADRDYDGKVSIDGEEIKGLDFKVNFKKTPILKLNLPLARPGTHDVDVELTHGDQVRSASFRFTEPLRYPDVDVEIARSPSTGKTRLMVRSNPYSLSLAVRDSLVVRGYCKYHRCSYIEDRLDYFTEWKELCDVVTLERSVPKTGFWYDLTATELLETTLTNISIKNTRWDAVWNNAFEGFMEYFVVDDGLSFFEVDSTVHYIKLDFEALLGVKVNVTCTDETVVLNGTPVEGGKHSYTISGGGK